VALKLGHFRAWSQKKSTEIRKNLSRRIHDSHGAEAVSLRWRLRIRHLVKAVRIGKMPIAGGIGLMPGMRQPEGE